MTRIEVSAASAEDDGIHVGAWPSINHQVTFRGQWVYRFTGKTGSGYVVAGYFAQHEDKGEYFEPGFFASDLK